MIFLVSPRDLVVLRPPHSSPLRPESLRDLPDLTPLVPRRTTPVKALDSGDGPRTEVHLEAPIDDLLI